MPHVIVTIFLCLVGLSVGSFLNVVIYRLPRGLSISEPARSFCPACGRSIAWYDNLPLLSWIFLGGRCRKCQGLISVQYPLVEALTGLIFVLVYQLLFLDDARAGLGSLALPADWPLLVAWLVLIAGLVACSAMDIVSYSVDVRITNIVAAAGILLAILWPRGDFLVPIAAAPPAAGALVAFIVTGIMLYLTVWRRGDPDEEPEPEADEQSAPESGAVRVAGVLAVAAFVCLALWMMVGSLAVPGMSDHVVPTTLVIIFIATVIAGSLRRSVDSEIHEEIESEQPQARMMACKELAWLMPAIILAGLATAALYMSPALAEHWQWLVSWSPAAGYVPVAGAVFAIQGAIAAAAAGWALRITFTLALGREAFGVGDIYILAAAGAAAGWDIALLGLLFSVAIALTGVIFGLVLKSTAIIPFGPWLTLGFLVALWLDRPAHRVGGIYRDNLIYAWEQRPDVLAIIVGLLLVGTAGALVLARLTRRWLMPDSHPDNANR